MSDSDDTSDPAFRGQLAWVLRLTGGELEDRPMSARYASKFNGETVVDFAYWYTGVPEYAGGRDGNFPDQHASGVEYRTIITCGTGPRLLVTRTDADDADDADDAGQRWVRVASYQSSGETECPHRDYGEYDPRAVADGGYDAAIAQHDARPCVMCEATDGEPHGYVYIGEGWCENVYRTVTATCDECGAPLDLPATPYRAPHKVYRFERRNLREVDGRECCGACAVDGELPARGVDTSTIQIVNADEIVSSGKGA